MTKATDPDSRTRQRAILVAISAVVTTVGGPSSSSHRDTQLR